MLKRYRKLLYLIIAIAFTFGVSWIIEWGERRQKMEAELVLRSIAPLDGNLSQNDIEVINERLGCEVNSRSKKFRITHIRGGG